MQPDSYAAGVRRRYQGLPREVRDWVESRLDGPVVSVRDARGGFSPGAAAVVSSGRTSLFVKAVGSAVNAEAARLYRIEAEVAARLPALDGLLAPVAWTELEAEGEHYAVIAYPALDGRTPQHPWRAVDLERCLTALHRLSGQLTPSPWPPGLGQQRLVSFFCGWQRIEGDPTDPWRTDPWLHDRLPDLVAAEQALHGQLPGETLSHIDLRADNIMLTPGPVWFVDWAHAENASAWVDAAILLSDVVASRADLGDGGEIDVAATARQVADRGAVPYATVWGLQLAMAGALHAMARQPSPPGLPTIRAWQGATAETLWRWCRRAAPAGW